MEEIAKKELEDIAKEKKLKISSININKGGVYFRSSISDAFTAGLFLRTAGRMLLNVKKIYFLSENDFYKKAVKFDWSEYIGERNTFKIETKFDLGVDKKLRNSHFMSLKLKDALVDQIREKTGNGLVLINHALMLLLEVRLFVAKGHYRLTYLSTFSVNHFQEEDTELLDILLRSKRTSLQRSSLK